MKRHAFRWDGVAFGLFFLAVLGQWAVWEHQLLSPDDLAFVAAAVLIVLGVLGIVGTAALGEVGPPYRTVHPSRNHHP